MTEKEKGLMQKKVGTNKIVIDDCRKADAVLQRKCLLVNQKKRDVSDDIKKRQK